MESWEALGVQHGNWSVWGNWSECSAKAWAGVRNRSRTCTNPVPRRGGRPCVGDSVQYEPCSLGLEGKDIYSSHYTLHVISKNVKKVKCTSDFVIFLLSIALQHYFLICVTVPKCEVKMAGYIFSCFCNKLKKGSRPVCSHLTKP